MKILKLLCLLIFVGACQKRSNLVYHEWDASQKSVAVALPAGLQLEKTTAAVKFRNKKIDFSRQVLNGKPVYNSFVKTISEDRTAELIQANYIDPIRIKNMSTDKTLHDLNYAAVLGPRVATFIAKEEVYIIESGNPALYLLVHYFDKSGVPYTSFFKSDGTLARTERQGSQFADINATIYSEGPKLSQLTEQLLKGLSITPALSNQQVFVTSESDKKINVTSAVLKFDPKDDRFDQLQVFYYLSKSFRWMKEVLQIEIPSQVEAVVHVGFPVKTNSAFYFRNKIRLGRGDDVTYTNLMQDPSIVYHESFHAMIDQLARLPFEGEGGSLNEAFADFFTCLLTERPYLGDSSFLKGPYKRTLQLNRRLDEKNGGLYHDSQIFSSLLWELKEKISIEKARLVALETLFRLNGLSQFRDFNDKIILAGNEVLNKDEQMILQQILRSRGFEYE